MGDLNSEIIELEWINLFYSSIQGKPNVNEDIECFRKYNYSPFPYNKFSIIVEEEGLEKPKEVTPDFILWNKEKEIVLIIEIKGENSVESKNLTQLNKYRDISIEEISHYILLISVINFLTFFLKFFISPINAESFSLIPISDDIEELAQEFVQRGAINESYLEDTYHIAIAILNEMDFLLSWNFRHIV